MPNPMSPKDHIETELAVRAALLSDLVLRLKDMREDA